MFYKEVLKKIKKEGKCPFCNLKKELIISENKYSYLTPAEAPYTKDHLLVIPKRHLIDLKDLKKKEKSAIFDLVIYGMKALKKKYAAIELEYKEGDMKIAGKSISHAHFHLLPKSRGNQVFSTNESKRRFLNKKEVIKEANKIKKW